MFSSLEYIELLRAWAVDNSRTVATVLGSLTLFIWLRRNALGPKLRHIPSIGLSSGSGILSYVDALNFLFNSQSYVENGMSKGLEAIVKIPAIFGWMVIVRGRDLVEDIRKMPDNVADGGLEVGEVLQWEYTFSKSIAFDYWHVPILKSQIKKVLADITPHVHEEVVASFDDYLSTSTDDWTPVVANDLGAKVIARAGNIAIVGPQMCRNSAFLDVVIGFTVDVLASGTILKLMPGFLRPYVSPWVHINRVTKPKAVKLLAPLIEERKAQIALLGDDYERPNDVLSWMLDAAPADKQSTEEMVMRLLNVNFAAIHTTNSSFVQALFDLAAHPQYAEPLREEVHSVVKEHGWNKSALDKMVKLDSFIRESLRHRPFGAVGLRRHLLKDVVLSNGVHVPAGVSLGVDMYAMHNDPEIYEDPTSFRPFRFAESTSKAKADFTVASPHFLLFGYGRHACPGRFFAAVEIKLMLAYLVLRYDVKSEKEGVRPQDSWFAGYSWPDASAKVLFRRRKDDLAGL